MKVEIADQAINRWRSILPQIGVAPSFLSNKQGPCPACGGKDRFRWDNRDGRGTFYCNACGAGDGVKLAMIVNGWTFQEAAARIRELLPSAKFEEPKRVKQNPNMARHLWGRAVPIGDDEVAAYLLHRGYKGPYSDQLRFHPTCPLYDQDSGNQMGCYPALLARVAAPDGSGVAVHRTYLQNGRKADIPSPRRMTAGSIPKGSSIRLFPHDGVLGIAEGIETALAVTAMFKIPCWSAISATMLAEFIWPEGLEELQIFGDMDANFAGQAAAYRLAFRAATARDGPRVSMSFPTNTGEDWDDVYRSKMKIAA